MVFVTLEEYWEEGVFGKHFSCLEEEIEAEERVFVGVLFWWCAAVFMGEAVVLVGEEEAGGQYPAAEDGCYPGPDRHC